MFMVRLQSDPIDYVAITEAVRSPLCGAVCLFLGTVREFTGGKRTQALTYEAHPTLAQKLLEQLEAETRARGPVHEVHIVHRLGHHDLGEISVAVAVSSPHREQAFEACRYAMDRLKEIVPIWKQEHGADGESQWVHPAKEIQ
jgi:molybdopterin synthase catalytic subunit